MTLEQHLALCMQQTALQPGITCQATDDLATALTEDPELANHARVVLAAGAGLEQRDHIARWRNAVLRRSLGEAGNV